jgi:hypothetical protein
MERGDVRILPQVTMSQSEPRLPLENAGTLGAYDAILARCLQLFEDKTADYGTAWRVLRPPSLTDQIFIKANRIRTLQEKGVARIREGIEPEFMGIINYGIIAQVQCGLQDSDSLDLPVDQAVAAYRSAAQATRQLMIDKNHDYGEAWRDMRVSSLTDLILMKVMRVKQIEDNAGRTRVSEGVVANYQDMVNYAFFALILLEDAAREARGLGGLK